MYSHICVLRAVSCQAVSTQIYIGCIYLVYLYSVSLNGQLEKMHSCTGCNRKVFHHYAFSNVGSKHLDQSMHSHTDHICMAFPLCIIKCHNCQKELLLKKHHHWSSTRSFSSSSTSSSSSLLSLSFEFF